MSRPALTIRLSGHRDAGALRRLASLDDCAVPAGRALIAERDGVAIAVLAVTSGAVVADRAGNPAVAIGQLRRRRYRLVRQGGHVAHLSTLPARAA